MSLATRCSACGTVFRVVQDQLKVSEGWVRCGRCNEVFNALAGLFDLDRETPPEWEPQDRDDVGSAGTGSETSVEAAVVPEADPPSDPRLVDRIDSELFGSRSSSAAAGEAFGHEAEPAGTPHRGDATAPIAKPDDDFAVDGGGEAPGFVRRAERAQRWNRPWVRAALGSAVLALVALLGVQFAHHFRDDIAARHPEAAPLLAAWCDSVGCRIGPPRHIDDVAVESTALSRAGGPDAYKLSVVLRNHGTTLVAVPAIDLALTDATGQLIARRTLEMRDFGGGAPDRVAAGAEVNLQTVLTAGSTKITGYTVELFYP